MILFKGEKQCWETSCAIDKIRNHHINIGVAESEGNYPRYKITIQIQVKTFAQKV